jgi:hypothetical protein
MKGMILFIANFVANLRPQLCRPLQFCSISVHFSLILELAWTTSVWTDKVDDEVGDKVEEGKCPNSRDRGGVLAW